MKLLLWIAIGLAVVWLFRKKVQHSTAHADKPANTIDSGSGATEAMVRCLHCGLHLPKSEAVPGSSGEMFCCDEHRSKHVSA